MLLTPGWDPRNRLWRSYLRKSFKRRYLDSVTLRIEMNNLNRQALLFHRKMLRKVVRWDTNHNPMVLDGAAVDVYLSFVE